MKPIKISLALAAVMGIGMLAGCGGSSGSGGGSSALTATQYAATARNQPAFGSVNQGPRRDSQGRTRDTAALVYTDSNGHGTVTATLPGIDTNPDQNGVQESITTTWYGAARSNITPNPETAADGTIATGDVSYAYEYASNANVFGHDTGSTEVRTQNPASTPLFLVDIYDGQFNIDEDVPIRYRWDGGLAAYLFTTYDDQDTTADYLTFGNWVYLPRGIGQEETRLGRRLTIAEYEEFGTQYGLFVDGTPHTDTLPTTGSATYQGFSYGFAESSGQPVGDLLARVRLTAAFTASGGSVSGTISDFSHYANPTIHDRTDDQNIIPNRGIFLQYADAVQAAGRNWGTVTLNSATINNGQFRGTAGGGAQIGNAQGNWGGQFFGNDGDGVAPPTIGGTWGVASGTHTLVGSFGTWKQPAPQSTAGQQ